MRILFSYLYSGAEHWLWRICSLMLRLVAPYWRQGDAACSAPVDLAPTTETAEESERQTGFFAVIALANVVGKMVMKEEFAGLSAREIAMIQGFRVLPNEVQNSIEKTIEAQARRYDSSQARVKSPPRLALVAFAKRR